MKDFIFYVLYSYVNFLFKLKLSPSRSLGNTSFYEVNKPFIINIVKRMFFL